MFHFFVSVFMTRMASPFIPFLLQGEMVLVLSRSGENGYPCPVTAVGGKGLHPTRL